MVERDSNQEIEKSIFIIRGQKVMFDADLAQIYGVSTTRLNEQVRRNIERFPEDFMFQLSNQEVTILMSQIATSSWGGRRKLPMVFTEHGVAMLSSVLNSKRAIEVNIEIIRAFIRLRSILAEHKEFAHKLDEMEKKYDTQFRIVFTSIRELMKPPEVKKKGRLGFYKDRT